MKAFVITMTDLDLSVNVSKRCIDSAKKFDINVSIFDAITPKNEPLKLLEKYDINESDFKTVHSRKLNGICCFLSHYSLWEYSIKIDEPIIIFEHDAIVISSIEVGMEFQKLISLGKPSFGTFKTPEKIGVNFLTSKKYLPGAHAYIIKPEGAMELIAQTKVKAKFTDTFINTESFPWVEEYYPWPVICDDNFTTVQAELGCKAKHNFNKGFKII